MRRTRIVVAVSAMAVALAGIGPAAARDPGDKQGFCKKQGPSECAGNSECGGPHLALLPMGQQKKC